MIERKMSALCPAVFGATAGTRTTAQNAARTIIPVDKRKTRQPDGFFFIERFLENLT
jgi:hypothetical protein